MNLYKCSKFASQITAYLTEAAVTKYLGSKPDRLSRFSENASKYARRGLKTLKVQVDVKGYDIQRMNRQNFLIVSNHMSYLDVLIMSSVQPSVFVTSVDMGEVFFLGAMAEMGGSVFVERRHRERVEVDRAAISNALKCGHNVVLYPEGTTSDGSKVLPFKKSLLMSAVDARVDILPTVLTYRSIDGKPFRPRNHDRVCWYGDMSFLPHLLRMLSLKSIVAELQFLNPIPVRVDSTRDELANAAYLAVTSAHRTSSRPPSYLHSFGLETHKIAEI